MKRRDDEHAVDEVWEELRYLGRGHLSGFEHLTKYRVRNILLVASLYDAFTLEEGGRLTELILTEYRELNLSSAPRIRRAATADEALALIDSQRFDLVLTMTRLGNTDANEFSRRVKSLNGLLPVIVLGYNERELAELAEHNDGSIDRLYVWSGDMRLLFGIIKNVEDAWNVDDDTRLGDVRCIIVVEDSIRFYSAYLPLIYAEIFKQTQDLMADGINLSQKLLRLRARPKILFATTFEEAWAYYERYRPFLLGAISDVCFPWQGSRRDDSGVEFIRRLKADDPTLPCALQSSDPGNEQAAAEVGATFLDKHSHHLLMDLRRFIQKEFGFGDFVFRMPDGEEIGRAHNTRSLLREMVRVPVESILHHAQHDHFSNWFRARTKFTLANRIKPRKVDEFASSEALRDYLVETIRDYRTSMGRGVVTDFSRQEFDSTNGFVRIGRGSLGGKGRGLAFMNHVLGRYGVGDHFPDVVVHVPPTAVVATDVYDTFLAQDALLETALAATDEQTVADAFLAAKLPPEIYDDLRSFLEQVRYPLAVRSSSLLEDAQHQPFAGVYKTYMIANAHTDVNVRLDQLCDAIKLVYASTFSPQAKSYLKATNNRVEEEKMAVVIQKVVGRRHEDVVYPDFAGVAHSTNHYPAEGMRPEDGVACVALGLGRTVVEGGISLRFSPREPRRLPQFGTIEDTLANSQRRFQALDVSDPSAYPTLFEDGNVVELGLDAAERHGTLQAIGSVYSPENEVIYDGISRPGPRLVTFAHVLKSGIFPLPELLRFLLEIARRSQSCAVEIEFAVNLRSGDQTAEFGLLQVRPLAAERKSPRIDDALFTAPETLIATDVALGNGIYADIRDVVLVDRGRFDRGRTPEIAAEVGRMNRRLQEAGRPYLLLGPGRWGSSDRWLGVPVQWQQIAGAAVIVESDLDDFRVTPSQGTHFFQNLTSFQMGYLTVNGTSGGGVLDWDWLESQAAVETTTFLRRLRFDAPLRVLIDGRRGRGVVLRPRQNDGASSTQDT